VVSVRLWCGGWQDGHLESPTLEHFRECACFGVFDGHCGAYVAEKRCVA
jgi:hypothetical protein